jgi:hypothetical protein
MVTGGGRVGNNAAEHILEYISREDKECISLFHNVYKFVVSIQIYILYNGDFM